VFKTLVVAASEALKRSKRKLVPIVEFCFEFFFPLLLESRFCTIYLARRRTFERKGVSGGTVAPEA
jgi:hypothetical protein